MKEYILSFLAEQYLQPEIFFIELAGITFPFPGYQVERKPSSITSFEYVLSGAGILEVDGISYPVGGGDCYLLPAGHNHRYWSLADKPMHKIWVNVKGSLPEQLVTCYHLQQQIVFQNSNLFPDFNRLLKLCETNLTPEKRSQACSLLFHEMLLKLAATIPQQAQLLPENLLKAKRFLDNHLQDSEVTIAQIAAIANLSTSQLTRQFKHYLKQTPYDYYLTKKVELAQLLLKDTLLSIQEIADRLGFKDEHYFSTLFKQKTSYTPTDWRKKG